MPKESIRALVRPATLPSEVRELESRYGGSEAGTYVDLTLIARGDRPRVTAISLVDAYEMVLGKECPYFGSSRDAYLSLELEQAGYDVTIVSADEFSRLISDQELLNNPDQ